VTSESSADACPLCGHRETSELFSIPNQVGFRIVRCAQCGLARTDPQPTDEELGRAYERDYATVSGRKFAPLVERARRAIARRLARKVALRAEGFTCTATEMNPRAARSDLAEKGVTVHVGALEELRFAPASFRVVVIRHVLEHLRDPAATLREIHRLLHPEGILVVEVPNLASWQARFAGARWFHLDVPRHLFHFTDATLAMLLDRTGFSVERAHHLSLEQGPYGWLQSFFNRLGPPWGGLYDQLRAPERAGSQDVPVAVVVGALSLLPFASALAVVESIARRGGSIELWARPMARA
jgi:SAM-dependent methyltransferase